MSLTASATGTFRHEAVLYDGAGAFVAATAPFIREGLHAGEPVMVAVRGQQIDVLRGALDRAEGEEVEFVDIGEMGRNPARIIPAWRDFVARGERTGAPLRGIGEPIWSSRSPEELVECQLHESLLNVAFADTRNFHLLCPYDRGALDPAVVHEACRSHPAVGDGTHSEPSRLYHGLEAVLDPFDAPLPPPPARARVHGFDRDMLADVREIVADAATEAGLERGTVEDLVLAVNEIATNSVRHGLGRGVLRVWRDGDALACEVRDGGHVRDPLAGRRTPAPGDEGGRGLWMANQLCDLVQVRSSAGGTTVRMFVRGPAPGRPGA